MGVVSGFSVMAPFWRAIMKRYEVRFKYGEVGKTKCSTQTWLVDAENMSDAKNVAIKKWIASNPISYRDKDVEFVSVKVK